MNSLMKIPEADDGWSQAASEASARTIRGALLKFVDWRWTTGKEATPIADGTRLIAMGTAAMWVRWSDSKPVEYRNREPGRRMPERFELGYENQDEWEIGVGGEPKDPWANTRVLYLIDPQTAEAYTFSTATIGGRGAVIDLADQITRMRTVYPDAVPVVELRSAEMKTRFGRKSKPLFKVVDWKTAQGPAPAERQITAQAAEQHVRVAEMDDEIPF